MHRAAPRNKGDNLFRLVIDLADGPPLELVVLNERHAEGPRGGRCLGIGAHLGREDRPTNLKRRENGTGPLHGRVARACGAVVEVVDVDFECPLDPVDDCLGLDGHRVDGSSGSGAFFEGEVRGGVGVVVAEVKVRRRVPCEGPLADRPDPVAQAEVLAHHIEAVTFQRVGGRHGQGLASGLRDGGIALRDAELQALPGVADEALGVADEATIRGNERVDHGGVDRIDEELLLVSRALQRRGR
eukprot:scaffold25788_cov86-Phaeocystis_antarctica.AAC.1